MADTIKRKLEKDKTRLKKKIDDLEKKLKEIKKEYDLISVFLKQC
jgi:hypothetical protein